MEPAALDLEVAAWVGEMRTDTLDNLFGAATHIGDTWALLLVGVALVLALSARGDRWLARLVAASCVSGPLVFVQALKVVVGRPRPEAADALIDLPWSASFPSGHAFGVIVVLGIAVWALGARWPAPRRTAVWSVAVAVMVLVGISRVYLGVHYATDVLASWALGTAWALGTMRVARRSALAREAGKG